MGGLLGKVQAEQCQGGDSRSNIVLQKAWTGQDVRLYGCMHYARREIRVWIVKEWLFQKKMTATDTVFFVFGSKSFCCRAAIHSARLCIVREGETPVLGRSCTRTTNAANHHIRLRHSLGEVTHLKPPKPKKKKNPWPYTSATSSYTLNMKQHEVRTRKFWGTEVSSHNSTHEPPLEMNASEVSCGCFCPQWHTSNFAWKLAQGVYI